MIGIITYISVLERTKEIGILRSLGARKMDIARVFNAETIIIGFAAGVFGVLVTVIINIPLNDYLISLAEGMTNIASLSSLHAILLVVVSMILTLIAGLVPSRIAAKKDPVQALRVE
jgi:putative ABC transport system permease protein